MISVCFFFNDTATTEIYTLSLHDALPIFPYADCCIDCQREFNSSHNGEKRPVEENYIDYTFGYDRNEQSAEYGMRSEEHTSELQSRQYLVCRLLLEKK